MEPDAIVIFITVPASGLEAASQIADTLLGKRKAACVNIVSAVESRYWWHGKIEAENELMLIVKTRGSLLEDVVSLVKSQHPNTVPEIIALPIVGGNEDYLRWVQAETS